MQRFLFLSLVAFGLWTGAVRVRLDVPDVKAVIDHFAHPEVVLWTDRMIDIVPEVTRAELTAALSGVTLAGLLVAVMRHRRRGKTPVQAIAAAVFPPPFDSPSQPVIIRNPAVVRAEAENLRSRLIADSARLKNELNKLAPAIVALEKESAWRSKEAVDAAAKLAECDRQTRLADEALMAVRCQREQVERELAEVTEAIEEIAG